MFVSISPSTSTQHKPAALLNRRLLHFHHCRSPYSTKPSSRQHHHQHPPPLQQAGSPAIKPRQSRPIQAQHQHQAARNQHHRSAPCSKQSLPPRPSTPHGLQSPHQQQHLRQQQMSWVQRPCLSHRALACTPAAAGAGTQLQQQQQQQLAQQQRCAHHGLLKSPLLATQHTGQALQLQMAQQGLMQSLIQVCSLCPAAVGHQACAASHARSCSRCTGASTAAAAVAAVAG
jgi:hypothetical protein